jgi:Uma2 family endonuclease
MTAPVLSRDCEQLTIDDWFTRPDVPERSELYQGVLIVAPPPDPRHQIAVSEILGALLALSHKVDGLAVVAPTGVALASDIGFEPDVLYLSPEHTHYLKQRGVEGPPDIVVEVASPGTRRFDRLTKLPTYLEYGVREVWIVDPETRTVEVHEPGLAEPRTARFGEPIPSRIVDIGSASLERVPASLFPDRLEPETPTPNPRRARK